MSLFFLSRMEVVFRYAMVAAHVSLSLAPEAFYAVDMAFLLNRFFRPSTQQLFKPKRQPQTAQVICF